MRISVIGSGRMGSAIIKSLASSYADLLWAGRDRAAVRRKIGALGLEERVESATHEAGLQAEIIILAIWQRDMAAFVQRYRPLLAGKILVDIANPFTADFNGFTTPWDSSAAEELQRLVPEARVVGALKSTFWVVFDDPSFPEGASDCYVTSDDEEAKRVVMAALQPLPFRVLDAGRLSNNRTIERMTLLAREIAVRYGFYPRVTWRLLGRESHDADPLVLSGSSTASVKAWTTGRQAPSGSV